MCRQGDNSETVDGRMLSSPFFVLPAKRKIIKTLQDFNLWDTFRSQ